MTETIQTEPADDTPLSHELETASRASPALQLVREWGPLVVGMVALGLLIRAFLFQSYEIPSESMLPTLEIGNRVVVNRLSYDFGEIERGQVVVFDRPEGLVGEDDLIKRIIGLPGETVRLLDGTVYVDGLRAVEPYVVAAGETFTNGPIGGCVGGFDDPNRCEIPPDHVFVLGDNRTNSEDSRFFGPVHVDTIVGRAFWTVWPPTDLGQL